MNHEKARSIRESQYLTLMSEGKYDVINDYLHEEPDMIDFAFDELIARIYRSHEVSLQKSNSLALLEHLCMGISGWRSMKGGAPVQSRSIAMFYINPSFMFETSDGGINQYLSMIIMIEARQGAPILYDIHKKRQVISQMLNYGGSYRTSGVIWLAECWGTPTSSCTPLDFVDEKILPRSSLELWFGDESIAKWDAICKLPEADRRARYDSLMKKHYGYVPEVVVE